MLSNCYLAPAKRSWSDSFYERVTHLASWKKGLHERHEANLIPDKRAATRALGKKGEFEFIISGVKLKKDCFAT